MKHKNLKKITALLLILSLVFSASACGKQADTGADGNVQTIVVGTGNDYEPYCYLDEKGNLTGYEIGVLKAIDELLPQYEFEYEVFEFKNILVGIDGGKIDLAAHQYEENEERRAKYLFSEESYTTYDKYVTVVKDRNDISGPGDLAGKKVRSGSANNTAYNLEKYNKEHPDAQINIIYSDETTEQIINNLENGTYDATIDLERNVEKYNREYGDRLKIAGSEPFTRSNTYYLYPKTHTELQKAVDGALKTLKESGKLAELSTEYIGKDYTPKN